MIKRKTVKYISQTVYFPVMSCGHKARSVTRKDRIRKEYFCYTCTKKENRKDEQKKEDYFSE